MNETSARKSWLDSFRIYDRESCARAIRNGGIAAMIVAGLSFVFGVAGFFTKSGRPQLDYVLDPAMLWDAGLVAILGVFLFRRSRAASTLLVLHLVLGKVMMWADTGSLQGLPMTLVFLAYYVTAMRGTYIWHSRYREPSLARPSARPVRRILIAVAGGAALTFVLMLAYGVFYSGPELSLVVVTPEAAVAGEPFQVELRLTNPHTEPVTLDSVEIDEEFFQRFELRSVSPDPSDDSPTSMFGHRSWAFGHVVEPAATETVVFELLTPSRGTFQLPLRICNEYLDCSGTPLSIRVE
jgi:hypothetical protein